MSDPAEPFAASPAGSPPPSTGPVTVDPAAVVVAGETPPVRRPGALGPGLLESLLWIAVFFTIEIFGSAAWMIAVLVYRSVTGGGAFRPDQVEELLVPVMPWMLGSLKLVEVAAAVIAIRLRFGRGAFRVTGFRGVPLVHVLILGFAVLPTAFLSGQCYALFHVYWDAVAEEVPFLKSLDEMSSIEAVEKMAEATPLAALVFVIAVLPALNEEFVFRAALGRGLLARYGLVAGVALTSMLFAMVHLSPVHAAALLPLAVLMHVGYLSSGSIWACVGVHFCNNALSVALMKLAAVNPELGGMATDVTETKFSPVLFLASAACVAATVWLLMRVRLRWLLPDGHEWRPEFPGVEPPPRGVEATPAVPPVPAVPLWTAAVCYLAFPVAVGVALMLNQV